MDIQQQLDEHKETQTETTTTEIAEKPLLTDAAIRADKRRTDLVEVNFSDQSARVVGTSDAPKLTLDVIKEKADPIQDAELIFDSSEWVVKVRMGVPFSVTAEHAKILEMYKEKGVAENLAEMHRAIKNLYIARMIDAPKFSYQGVGEGPPVEECSDLLTEALLKAYAEKNNPLEPDIYQVNVLRGQPIHASLLLSETFEAYPLGQAKATKDMTDAEIEQTEERGLARRRIFVSSMVLPEGFHFSYNGEGNEGVLYPVEDISELYLQTLHQAYRVSNVPEAGLDAVRRFQRMESNQNGGAISAS